MTILELIQAECRAKGVNEKHAEKIQKLFNITKEEGLGNYVAMFKDNVLPDLDAAEKTKADAEKAARQAAILEYEKAHNIKDGKPIETPKPDEVDLTKLSPELQAYFKAQQAAITQLTEAVSGIAKGVQVSAKTGTAREQFTVSKLPEKWFGRIDVNSETPIEDQIKDLQTEYTEIQQAIINGEVEKGTYKPNPEGTPKDRTEKEWETLMNEDKGTGESSGTANLGLE